MEEDGFEPSKSVTTDLQSAPLAARELLRMKLELVDGLEPPDLLITNQLLYQLSYTSTGTCSSATKISLSDGKRFVKHFLKKEDFFATKQCGREKDASGGRFPSGTGKEETPRFFCAQCGQEQYTYDPPAVAGLCPQCRRRNRQREENAMTLQEMSVEYRAQAQVPQGRIEALKQTQDTLDHGAARDQMALRIQTLQTIWRKPGTWRSFWNTTMRGVPPQCALHAIDDIGSPAQTCWCTPASWRRTMGRSCSVCATPWAMPCGRRSPAGSGRSSFSTTTKTTPWRRSAPSWGGPHHRLPAP